MSRMKYEFEAVTAAVARRSIAAPVARLWGPADSPAHAEKIVDDSLDSAAIRETLTQFANGEIDADQMRDEIQMIMEAAEQARFGRSAG
jgi:hypothetical protein